MTQRLFPGDVLTLDAGFCDPVTGAPIDPATVKVKVKLPDTTVLTYEHGTDPELMKVTVGNYQLNLPLTVAGDWWVRWESTGAYAAAEEARVVVLPSQF